MAQSEPQHLDHEVGQLAEHPVILDQNPARCQIEKRTRASDLKKLLHAVELLCRSILKLLVLCQKKLQQQKRVGAALLQGVKLYGYVPLFHREQLRILCKVQIYALFFFLSGSKLIVTVREQKLQRPVGLPLLIRHIRRIQVHHDFFAAALLKLLQIRRGPAPPLLLIHLSQAERKVILCHVHFQMARHKAAHFLNAIIYGRFNLIFKRLVDAAQNNFSVMAPCADLLSAHNIFHSVYASDKVL